MKVAIVTTRLEEHSLAPNKMIRSINENIDGEAVRFYSIPHDADFLLVETKSEKIIHEIRRSRIKNSAENFDTIRIDEDKTEMKKMVTSFKTPKCITVEEYNGESVFVKPLYLEDSLGIDDKCICNSIDEVEAKCLSIFEEHQVPAIIEEYIEGKDITIGVIYTEEGDLIMGAIELATDEGILTYDVKVNDVEKRINFNIDDKLKNQIEALCEEIQLKNYARFDFRLKDGELYLLEINLYAGLSEGGYMANCFHSVGINYAEMLKMIIQL